MKKNQLLNLLSILLLIAIIVLWFVGDVLVYSSSTISYLKSAFGYSEAIGPITVTIIGFSFLNFLPLLLIVLNLLILLLKYLKPKLLAQNTVSGLSVILMLAGAVLLFLNKSFIVSKNLPLKDYQLTTIGKVLPFILIFNLVLQLLNYQKK